MTKTRDVPPPGEQRVTRQSCALTAARVSFEDLTVTGPVDNYNATPSSNKHAMVATKRSSAFIKKNKPSSKPTSTTSLKLSTAKHVKKDSYNWGPFLSERQWATIREDCSRDGSCWEFCTYESSHENPYIGGEDGLMGISDDQCRLCFSWGFWNEKDPFVKEKIFGVKGGNLPEGNHGEDVKDVYFYQTNTPNHDYMKMKYMYPCSRFPYEHLREENIRRSVHDDEFEIYDTEVFDHGFWELKAEYSKLSDGDVAAKLTATNHSSSKQTLHVLPTLWYRNTWNTLYNSLSQKKPHVPTIRRLGNSNTVVCDQKDSGTIYAHFQPITGKGVLAPKNILFCNNEVFKKNLISKHIVAKKNNTEMVHLPESGTKCSAQFVFTCRSEEKQSLTVVLSPNHHNNGYHKLEQLVTRKKQEAEDYYNRILQWVPAYDVEIKEIAKLAYSGLMWNKQYYTYNVLTSFAARDNLHGAGQYFKWNPSGWDHLDNHDIMSMPDKWEFPWYASWDTCFHAVVLVDIDRQFAQNQLQLILSSRFMSANGQVQGCEFNFSDENPPVYAWAVWEVYKTTQDIQFLKNIYPKLLKNFQWWISERQVHTKGHETIYFKSGFLGMDNISAMDRSKVPANCALYTADAYAWVFITALNSFKIAIELNKHKDMPFWIQWIARLQHGFTHFSNSFCYDILATSSGNNDFVYIKSMVGLLPLAAVETFTNSALCNFNDWSRKHKLIVEPGRDGFLISLLSPSQRKSVIEELFAKNAFLGPFGVRMLSKFHEGNPYSITVNDQTMGVGYEPGESRSRMYMGNSNWRGPVWLCMNYMLVQALLKLHSHAPALVPTQELGVVTLKNCAKDICRRILGIFRFNTDGIRAVHGKCKYFQKEGPWSDAEYILFYEYFHGDTGRGCGASHQTGWTALVISFMKILFKKQSKKS